MTELETLLERFRRGAELIAATISGMSGSESDFSPAPGKWSARQIVAHLADTELVVAVRMRLTIAEETPSIAAFDQDRWAQALDYSERRMSDSLELLRAVRIANFELLRGLPATAFARKARHSERGEITLMDLLSIYTHHVENHAKQIEKIREKCRDSRPKI